MTRKRKIVLSASAVAIVALIVALVMFSRQRRKPPSDVFEVPLGVEEAVIMTTDSPIDALPFAWGVGVNVRIANERHFAKGHVYDVRYIVNRAGDFDIKDFVRYSDGRPSTDLPSFKVRGLERLSKDIAAKIAETEDTRVGLRAWYYETLTIMAAAWGVWLLLLIFVHRRRAPEAAPEIGGPTLADQIRTYLRQLEAGSLDARQRAELELMIFRQWRENRSLADQTMADSLAAFRADPEVADAYAELESWLHRREHLVSPAKVAEAVRAHLEKPVAPQTQEALAP